ncbi:MAG TPA: histidine triad nucleotide-binding protein [Nitrospinota bacterium]|nr:histidine triad nucleotide-binding protein [Nitrospinota bacterium]|tara:strand:- start:4368 stop:4712 length:345 start_codon:yes stop_codon:yes gene_type:complete
MSDCLFCEIVAGNIPCKKVEETDTLLAFEDINPVAPIHVLVIPKTHIADVLGITDNHSSVIADMYSMVNKIAKDRGLDKMGFRLVVNNGSEAGQTVFHLHFHLLGGRPMAWPPG